MELEIIWFFFIQIPTPIPAWNIPIYMYIARAEKQI